MRFRLKNNIDFRIKKNKYNKGFLPRGMFYNIPLVKHNGIWYKCSIKFENNNIKIYNLILHHDDGYTVKQKLTDVFFISEVNKVQRNLILFYNNTHLINRKLFMFKKNIVERKKTILVFIIAIFLSVLYYIANIWTNNAVLTWVSNSLFAQTFVIFLTLSGFINIFTPFTIQKEITKKDIEKISKSKILKEKQLEEQNKISSDIASI